MYEVLDKDTINFELMPQLYVPKRGYGSIRSLWEAIIFGHCKWEMGIRLKKVCCYDGLIPQKCNTPTAAACGCWRS